MDSFDSPNIFTKPVAPVISDAQKTPDFPYAPSQGSQNPDTSFVLAPDERYYGAFGLWFRKTGPTQPDEHHREAKDND
ncbi:hypothetical protein ACTXT7_001531 [Hymenolepis weldensis]